MAVDGAGRLHLVDSVPVLRPDEQVLQKMLDGWRNQQLSRNLQFATIDQRLRIVQRFMNHVNEDPWNWTPAMVEEFSADLRMVKKASNSTLRGHHSALRAFTTYISDPQYGFVDACVKFFGTHPSQVFFDWNTATHVEEYDGQPTKRPYTREEIVALFDHADDEVERIGKSDRKGWQAAYRLDDRHLSICRRRVQALHTQERPGSYGEGSNAAPDRGRHIMKRKVDYIWRLPELMAARGLHNTTDLIPLLQERDITLSRPQVYRLVNQRPERVSLMLIAALCDIFDCDSNDLVTTTATEVRARKAGAAASTPPNVVSLDRTVRPRRANILDD